MTTFIKLAFAALLLNACVQAGQSAWSFYKFEDAVHQAVLFSAQMTPAQLTARVHALAAEHDVPVDPDAVAIRFVQTQAVVTGSYTDDVPIVPGGYTYKWTHALDMNVRRVPY